MTDPVLKLHEFFLLRFQKSFIYLILLDESIYKKVVQIFDYVIFWNGADRGGAFRKIQSSEFRQAKLIGYCMQNRTLLHIETDYHCYERWIYTLSLAEILLTIMCLFTGHLCVKSDVCMASGLL